MSTSKYRTSCDACLNAKVRCSQTKPSCGRCNQGGQTCKYSQYRRLGRPPKRLAPNVSPLSRGGKGPSSNHRKESPRLRSQPTMESHTQEHIRHANIRPKTGTHYLKSGDVEKWVYLDSTSAPRLASAHEWPLEDLYGTEEGMSGSFDLMPEFDSFDKLDLSASDFLVPASGFGLLPSISSPGQIPSEETIDTRSPVEPFTDPGQQSPPALTLASLESRRDFSSPASPTCGPHYLSPAATRATTPVAQRPSKIPSTPDTGCQNRCYTGLMEQLSRLRSVRSSSYIVPFDIILSHDKDVRRQREIILACPSCMGASRSRQTTLLPMVMVFESLIRLFEWDGDGDRCCYYHHKHLHNSCSDRLLRRGEERPPTPTSPAGISGQRQQLQEQRDHHLQGPIFHMPQTSKPVLIGHFEVDEPAKAVFLRQLLRLHLDKHMVTVSELSERLSMDPEEVNYKVAKEILADIRRRIEHFQGCLLLRADV